LGLYICAFIATTTTVTAPAIFSLPITNQLDLLMTEETAYRMEKIFTIYISDKELLTRIYKKLKKLTLQKINNPMNK
jgi:hypothetical protein